MTRREQLRDLRRPMKWVVVAAMAILLALTSILLMPAGVAGAAQASGSQVQLTLPRGRAIDGRVAFEELKCTACHRVDGESEFPSPVSASPGPDLGARQAARGLDHLATSIVTPSHEISLDPDDDILHDVAGLTSPMGDYSRAMTVRQLVDVLAYLESLGASGTLPR